MSTVGDDQMLPPAGPNASVPFREFLPRGFGSSMVYVFHSSAPVLTSSAVRLPRKVQHLLSPRPALVSSPSP